MFRYHFGTKILNLPNRTHPTTVRQQVMLKSGRTSWKDVTGQLKMSGISLAN